MPNIFTNCCECNNSSQTFKDNLLILDYLNKSSIPTEIGIKVIKLSQNINNCDYCSIYGRTNKLCDIHYKKAKKSGKLFGQFPNKSFYTNKNNGAVCSTCCFEFII